MKPTSAQRKALVACLRRLASGEIPDTTLGICWNLHFLVRQSRKIREYLDAYDVVSHYSVKWPGRTGELYRGMHTTCCYPIKREYTPGGDRMPLWEGSQREQRMSLIEYLIQELQA